MKTITNVAGNPLVDYLIANFKECLSYFLQDPPFEPEQLKPHKKTIDLRNDHGSAAEALKDNDFLDSLADTLQAWGVGARGTELVGRKQFRSQLRKHEKEIATLDRKTIEEADDSTEKTVWQVIQDLDIATNLRTEEPTKSKIVGGSKALHHLLPELVLPIDRKYTALFLFRAEPSDFQNPLSQPDTFSVAFKTFREIARRVRPATYVEPQGWNTSRTKVIDNAMVGLIRGIRDQQNALIGGDDPRLKP